MRILAAALLFAGAFADLTPSASVTPHRFPRPPCRRQQVSSVTVSHVAAGPGSGRRATLRPCAHARPSPTHPLPCRGTTATAPTLSHGSTSSGTRSPSLGSTSSGSPSRCVEGRTGTLARCSCPTLNAARLPASPLSRTLPLCSGTTTRAMSSGCVGGAGGARAAVTQRAAPRWCLLGELPSPRSPSPCSSPHCLPCVQSQNRNNVRGGWGLHAHGWARARGPCTLVLCSARARAPPLSLPCTVPS